MRDTDTHPPPVCGLDEPTVLASPRPAVRAALVGKSGVAARSGTPRSRDELGAFAMVCPVLDLRRLTSLDPGGGRVLALVERCIRKARGRLLIVRGDEAAGWFFDLIGVDHELALVDPSTALARIAEAMPR